MTRTIDYVDLDLSRVVLNTPTIPLFRKWLIHGGVVVDEKVWREHLDACDHFSAVVYSANGDAAGKCKKLIAAKTWGRFPSSCEVRLAANVHTKLYLIKRGWDSEVWVGSRNLTLADSYHNVMVHLHDEGQIETLRLYFKKLWNLSKQFGKPLDNPQA